MQDDNNRRNWGTGSKENIQELFVFTAQLFCKSINALKKSIIKRKSLNGYTGKKDQFVDDLCRIPLYRSSTLLKS